MSKRRSIGLLLAGLVTVGSAAVADTVSIKGIGLTTPDGWSLVKGPFTTLLPSDSGHFIEVRQVRSLPAADPGAISLLFANRKRISDVVISSVSSARGMVTAKGTLRLDGTPTSIVVRGVTVDKRAVVVVSFIETGRLGAYESIHDAILGSITQLPRVTTGRGGPGGEPYDPFANRVAIPVDILDCDVSEGPQDRYRRRQGTGQEVIAVGVYEAQPGATNRHLPQHATLVDTRPTPHILLLSSYEPVTWRLDLKGSGVTQVIASGYYRPKIEGAPAGVALEVRSTIDRDANVHAAYHYRARDADGNPQPGLDPDWVALDAAAKADYGAPIAYFAGCYRGSRIEIGP